MKEQISLSSIIFEEVYKDFLKENPNTSFSPNREFMQNYTDLIINQCGYYADIFSSVGCPEDMDETETKPSDYIEVQMQAKRFNAN